MKFIAWRNLGLIAVVLTMGCGLYGASRYSYILFHTIVEMITIVIGCGIFMLTWHSRRFFNNNYLLLVGIASLFISLIDFIHTLTYKGMGIVGGIDADIPTQLWIIARFMQSLTLLAAPLFLERKFKPGVVFGVYAVFTALLVGSVYLKFFPPCYVEGVGLTAFKKIAEYIISFILLASAFLLFTRRKAFDRNILVLLITANGLSIFAEMAFTFYVGVYDFSNLIGHLLKLAAFGCVYFAVIRTGLEKPYDLLFWSLKQSETALQTANDRLEAKVGERTLELDNANVLLRADLFELERSEVQIKQQLARIAALHAIDLAITKNVDFNQMAAVVLENVEQALKVDAAAILLFNKQARVLEFAALRGFRSDMTSLVGVQFAKGPAVRAALTQTLVHIPDLMLAEEYLPRQQLFEREGFCTYYAAPLVVDGRSLGVLEVFTRTISTPQPEWVDFLLTLAGQTAVAVDKVSLLNSLRSTNADLMQAYDATITGWSLALDLRDPLTVGHSQRVAALTIRLARGMGMSESEIIQVRRGALLHDIGVLSIPDGVLFKHGPLDESEWKIVQRHPILAYEMLSPIQYLFPALDIPYCHHEKWDGSGYPRGLSGEDIPLAARVFAVVDVWDALRFERPYRPAWEEDRVLAHIQAQAGSHFDPRVVDAFLSLMKQGNRPASPDQPV